ncbi:hypothetical protein KFE25_000125 [Diacronema lutheri]|uniref:F-box domain-containing protein n=1 Tax=Diacronema lutheri TaxID=2081491 RepID=A0A8J6C6X2_DIALT|nr:hypothetical protein KFE25_000125 [Diacronema lutheri]
MLPDLALAVLRRATRPPAPITLAQPAQPAQPVQPAPPAAPRRAAAAASPPPPKWKAERAESLIEAMLTGDALRRVASMLDGGDAFCFSLVCTAFKAHAWQLDECHERIFRTAFLRTVPRMTFALDLPGFQLRTWEELLALAATVGNVEFARAHGCPWDERCYYAARRHAAYNGCSAALDWTRANGCPGARDDDDDDDDDDDKSARAPRRLLQSTVALEVDLVGYDVLVSLRGDYLQ